MIAECPTMKGQCLFDEGRYCENRDCRDCQVFSDAVGAANRELGLCEDCGVDRVTVKEMLSDDKHSDNYWTARAIINNCPACQRYFGGNS